MQNHTVENNITIIHSGMQKYQFGDTIIYIDGIIFAYGKKAGINTIKWLYEKKSKDGYIPYEDLRGAYSCIIVEKERTIAFCDNSNMHCLFYSSNILSNSFLKAVESEAESGRQLEFNLGAICEYLTIGNVFFNKTFFQDIHILDSKEIATIEENKITISSKPIGDIDDSSNVSSISEYFEKIAFSLSEMKVCQALTGGYDSRIIYTCLSKRIEDHPAISSNDTKNKDVKYAQKVAIENQDVLEIVYINKPVFSEKMIEDIFEKKDGIVPFDIDSDIRLLTFKTKIAEKYNLHLSGDGGVLHKDWEWIQDFPLYRKKKSNAKQFYRQRLYNISIENHIGKQLRSYYDSQQERFTNVLNQICKKTNTQSYDSWYYRVSGNRRTDYNSNPIKGLISYAPLNELDIVRYSYALPRRKRFFYFSMRNTITKENIKIARIKTNYGTTASDELPFIARDVIYQSVEYVRKVYRLLGRKLRGRNVLNKSVLDWTLETEMRSSHLSVKAVDYAKQNEFIRREISLSDLSFSEIQRLIHIYYLHIFVMRHSCM